MAEPDVGLQCRRWTLTGRVQGVGFRWFALKEAQAMGIRGWVANTADGAVEVVGLATLETLDRFFLYTGVGAAIWCTVLLGIGWVVGKAGGTLARDQVEAYSRYAVMALVPVTIALIAGYVWWYPRSGKRSG